MPHAYTEDQLVEQPAIGLFAELGWAVAGPPPNAGVAGEPRDAGLLGRETKGEVVLVSRLRAALERLNPALPPEAITAALDELTRDRSAISLPAANREIYGLVKDGIRVSVAQPEDSPSSPALLPAGEGSSVVPSTSGRGTKGEGSRRDSGGQRTERVRVIDWGNPAANDFLLVSQFSVTGALYTCRPDLVCFVNGLPLVVIELKKPGVPARAAFDENLTHYKAEIPQLFWFNALLIASNGTDSRVGSLTADWERFFEWKRIERENEPRRVSLEVMLRGTCDQARLLDLVENFTLFSEHKAGLVKILAQNHQFLGVNNAIASLMEIRGSRRREETQFLLPQVPPSVRTEESQSLVTSSATGTENGVGVFWHTQGSGKSYSMVFFAQKVLRKVPGNWTFVVVTDRVELDDQIAKTFKATGAVSETEGDQCHAASGVHLRELLRGNHRYVFTLVHKFQPESPSGGSRRGNETQSASGGSQSLLTSSPKVRVKMPVLSDRPDIIVLTDEAHRSQYDTLALNMRAALPKALFLAFTGTPLIATEERTKEVFGDYVSIYDFQQSVEDGATVPLFYENRTPELQLTNPTLNEDIYQIVEEAGLDEQQEERLAQLLGKQYHLITRDDRLETVAADIARHFLGRGFQGKAMVVSIDKATALRMYDKVRKHWQAEMDRVKAELAGITGVADDVRRLTSSSSKSRPIVPSDPVRVRDLQARLKRLETVDMALIVSPGQNEIEQMKKLGLDIAPHRRRMNESRPPLDERFKDPEDPLSLVFVCAMWLTGFDAPSCSTVYLDKPMRNHTLMQTIARANRVYPGKHSGVIVDYANVFASLEKALAIYGAGKDGHNPVRDKQKLVDDLRKATAEASQFCDSQEVHLDDLEALTSGNFQLLDRLDDAVNALIAPDPIRRQFLAHERIVRTLYQAVKPDPAAISFTPRVSCIVTLANSIRQRTNPGPADVSAVLDRVNTLLDESIEGVTMTDHPVPVLDLSRINFEVLARQFNATPRKQLELENLKAAIRRLMDRLIRLNRTRIDFQEKFEQLIEAYNAGSKNIEELFQQLLDLSRSLTEEEQRHVREHLSEEELTIFDLLTRPGPELTPAEREEVKKAARHLLERVKEVLVLDWRQRGTARARVRLTIEDTLDDELPRSFTPELFTQKVTTLFEHIYESYPGEPGDRRTG